MKYLREIPDSVLVLAIERFMKNDKMTAIRDLVNAELAQLNIDKKISRVQAYALPEIARERNYFNFTPPRHFSLSSRIKERYRLPEGHVHVANARELDQVAATAANLLVDLVHEVGEKNDGHVHIGVGGGWTTRLVAKHLANRLRSIPKLPELTIHALTSGFDAKRPDTAPVAFFGFFDGIATKINYIGLFAPAVVEADLYKNTINQIGVKESFDLREQINLVVTSLGIQRHKHGDFYRFMQYGKKKGINTLLKAGWVGDVQYRPFGKEGPITLETDIRTVTLLELDELRKMADHENKHVVVVAGPCGSCRATRADALEPLLEEDSLRVWSHVVIDSKTAAVLLGDEEDDEPTQFA